MAYSEFGFLTPNQIKTWEKKDRHEWKRKSWIIQNFAGKGQNQPIELITSLKATLGGGLSTVMQLVNNLQRDGMVGSMDGNLEGNEEAMGKSEQTLQIDQLMHSVKAKGDMERQNEVVDFRVEGNDALTYWGARSVDQLAMLTMSGIDYSFNLNGSKRGYFDKEGNYILDPTWQNLKFAADVTPPSAKRHLMWDAVGQQLVLGDTTAITPASKLCYDAIVNAKAYARTHRVQPLMQGGKEWYIMMVTPFVLAQLKTDEKFMKAIIQAGVRGNENPWFTGAAVKVDGVVIWDTDYVFNTTGAAAGQKWGPDGNVDGARNLLLGSQALGFADLQEWQTVEKKFQYGQHPAIFKKKMMGFKKPVYKSTVDMSNEDFGVVAFDTYTTGGGALAPLGQS